MSASRLKSLGKLALLLGLPVILVGGLFGAGVYVGERHRVDILTFERDWLGRDVVVPGAPATPVTPPTSEPAKPEPTPEPVKTEPAKPEPTKPEPTKPEPTKPEPTKPEPTKTEPEPTPGPAALSVVSDPVPVPVAAPAPLPAAQQGRLAEPVRVRVKVVVDDELFDRRRDWIAYAQRNVAWASQILERQIGVTLELRGVAVAPAAWTNREAALAELAEIPREGADLVIGLSGRAGGGSGPRSAAPTATEHAPFAVAFGNPASRAPHLRALLAAASAAMSVAPLDPGDPAYKSGSWMGDPSAPDSLEISLDERSRDRLLERKHLPFATQIAAAEPAAATGELEHAQEGVE